MPASEIDDIFAGKSKTAASAGRSAPEVILKSAAKKKRKQQHSHAPDDHNGNDDGAVSHPAESSSAPLVAPSSSSHPETIAKKKRKQTTAHAVTNEDDAPRRPPPEMIIDPSIGVGLPSTLPPPKKTRKNATGPDSKNAGSTKFSKSKPPEDDNDRARFTDSRGTGPRKRTEEGWAVYKEDELGIADAGGDTPLCPFDCDCCF